MRLLWIFFTNKEEMINMREASWLKGCCLSILSSGEAEPNCCGKTKKFTCLSIDKCAKGTFDISKSNCTCKLGLKTK